MRHLVDLDALPHQDLQESRYRLGVRLAGGDYEGFWFTG